MKDNSQIIIYGQVDEIDNITADLLSDILLWDDDDLYRVSKNPEYKPSVSRLAKKAIQKYLMSKKNVSDRF